MFDFIVVRNAFWYVVALMSVYLLRPTRLEHNILLLRSYNSFGTSECTLAPRRKGSETPRVTKGRFCCPGRPWSRPDIIADRPVTACRTNDARATLVLRVSANKTRADQRVGHWGLGTRLLSFLSKITLWSRSPYAQCVHFYIFIALKYVQVVCVSWPDKCEVAWNRSAPGPSKPLDGPEQIDDGVNVRAVNVTVVVSREPIGSTTTVHTIRLPDTHTF